MKTLNEDFDGMIAAAWKGMRQGSPQYDQLKDAFIGGALCAFNRCQAAAGMNMLDGLKELERLNREIEEHHRLAHTRAKLWTDIKKAGER